MSIRGRGIGAAPSDSGQMSEGAFQRPSARRVTTRRLPPGDRKPRNQRSDSIGTGDRIRSESSVGRPVRGEVAGEQEDLLFVVAQPAAQRVAGMISLVPVPQPVVDDPEGGGLV